MKLQCIPCPSCATCESDSVVLKDGWRLEAGVSDAADEACSHYDEGEQGVSSSK